MQILLSKGLFALLLHNCLVFPWCSGNRKHQRNTTSYWFNRKIILQMVWIFRIFWRFLVICRAPQWCNHEMRVVPNHSWFWTISAKLWNSRKQKKRCNTLSHHFLHFQLCWWQKPSHSEDKIRIYISKQCHKVNNQFMKSLNVSRIG